MLFLSRYAIRIIFRRGRWKFETTCLMYTMVTFHYNGTAKEKQKQLGTGAFERLKVIPERRFLLRDTLLLSACFILFLLSSGRSNIAACGMPSWQE